MSMRVSDAPCREEINIKRLLTKCEEMSQQKPLSWRLEKFIESLEGMMNELADKPYKPSLEVMASYNKRLAFLRSYIHVQSVDTPLEKAKVLQAAPKPTLAGENKDVEHAVSEAVHRELREELLGKNDSTIRKRTTFADSKEDTADLDEILKHHHLMQEKIAENMLALTRTMKEQSIVASNIIRNDTKNIEKSSQLTDKNIDNLKVQSERLQENSRRTSHCWIWVMLIIVCAVFINMVLLMKMTKKK